MIDCVSFEWCEDAGYETRTLLLNVFKGREEKCVPSTTIEQDKKKNNDGAHCIVHVDLSRIFLQHLNSLKKTFLSSCLHLFTPKLSFKTSILQGCILIHCCKHASHTIYWEFLKYSVSWMANRFHYPPEIYRSRTVEEKEKETSGNEDMKRG